MNAILKTAIAGAIVSLAGVASAQSSVTLYGDIDQYVNYMKSSSGTHVLALEDGAMLRSRWGLRGTEDLGSGYAVKFNLEGGFSADNGTSATTGALFDRQAWGGLVVPGVGEFRAGRQNTAIFTRGGEMDFTARTLGSVLNSFNVIARLDNDLSFISSRFSGVQVETHVSLPETTGSNHQVTYQLAVDYKNDIVTVGYAGLRARPPANATVNRDVEYDNLYGNVKLGAATVYAVWVHTNNVTSSGTGAALLNTAGSIVAPVGSLNAGTSTNLNNFYDLYQLSADYKITPQLRVGGLWGKIQDKSGRDQGASGGAIGAYYDLSKRTTLLALVDTIHNDTNGSYRPAGSAALKSNFTTTADVQGKNITGVQAGFIIKF
jgi:predicted porin